MLAWRSKRGWAAAIWIFTGEVVCLGLSPEIGFAFLLGSFTFALYCLFHERTVVGVGPRPLRSCRRCAFLLIEGWPYLNRLGGFRPTGSIASLLSRCRSSSFFIRPGMAGAGMSGALFPPATSRGADVGSALPYVAGAASCGLWKGRSGARILERPFGIAIVGRGDLVPAPMAADRLGRLPCLCDSMDVQYQPARELV